MNALKNERLRQSNRARSWSVIVVLVAVSSIVALILFGTEARQRFRTVDESWQNYNRQASAVASGLAKLRSAIGYGGFIHSFKNYVLRQDANYLVNLKRDAENTENVIAALEQLLPTMEERKMLGVIRATLKRYMDRIGVLPHLPPDANPAEIDKIVKVDDGPALQAMDFLQKKSHERSQLQEQNAERALNSAGEFFEKGIFIIILIAAAAMVMIVFLRRLIKVNIALDAGFSQIDTLLSNSPDPMLCVAPTGEVVRANDEALKLFGYSYAEMIGIGVEKLVPEDFRDTHANLRSQFFDLPEARSMAKNRLIFAQTRDGRKPPVEITLSHSGDGEDALAIVNIRDVTSQREIQHQLAQAKQRAEDANKAKSEFLASMSHELRTPLNAVLGFAQMLELDPRHPLSQPQKEHVASIMQGGNHLLNLVNEVLDLARVEAGQMEVSLESIDANEIVASCVYLSAPLGESRGITIIDRFSSGLHHDLWSDVMRLKQILLNLLSNAVKYNKDGGTVTIEGEKTSNNFLRVSVTDTGVGIAESDQGNVFHMFHRLGIDSTRAREGTGIGLNVTKLLVERLAGRIGFESEIDAGSTFWIELPLVSNETSVIWDQSMEVGVEYIDYDHQLLVALLNRVSLCTVDDMNLDELIEELFDYTRWHFRREEAIMAVCHHPDLAEHKDRHQALIGQLAALAEEWRSANDPELLHQFRKFLRAWLSDHILNTDADIRQSTIGKTREIEDALERLKHA